MSTSPTPTRAVWKYTIVVQDDAISIDTKVGAEFLDAQPATSGRVDEIDVWFLVNPTAPDYRRGFVVRGTGQHVPTAANEYRATVVNGRGPLALVWHLFEVA